MDIDLDLLEREPGAIWSVFAEVEQRISLLPPLQEALRQPYMQRDRALYERSALLGMATLHPISLLVLAQLFQDAGLDIADYLYGPHPPSLLAREKQALLPAGVHVQKTVSLLLGGRLLLITSVGDHLLLREERFVIAEKLGLSRKEARQATLNPESFVAERELGVLRGMISPFLPPGYGANLTALVHTTWKYTAGSVAISLSPCESLFIPLHAYGRMLASYVQWSGLPLLLLK